jgi:hypothetical protein
LNGQFGIDGFKCTIKEAGEILSVSSSKIKSWVEYGLIGPDTSVTKRTPRLAFKDLVSIVFLVEAARSGMSYQGAAAMAKGLYQDTNTPSVRDEGIADFEWSFPNGEMFMVMYCNVERIEQMIRSYVSGWLLKRSRTSRAKCQGNVLRIAC